MIEGLVYEVKKSFFFFFNLVIKVYGINRSPFCKTHQILIILSTYLIRVDSIPFSQNGSAPYHIGVCILMKKKPELLLKSIFGLLFYQLRI